MTEHAPRTLLVTGGAGFIGSNYIRSHLDNYPKDRIINLDLLTYAGIKENLNDVERKYPDRYSFVRGNIGNKDLVHNIFQTDKPTVVVNFAAESHNSNAVTNPGVFMETNAMGTQRLLDVARQYPLDRFHQISTCEVYGDMDLETQEGFTEDSPLMPRTPYNASKAAGDLIVRAYHQTFDVPTTTTVCSNNYGPNQFPEKVIPLFITSGLQGNPLTVYESSGNRREWLHVSDHARAIDLVLDHGEIGRTYNVGSGVELSIDQLADTVLAQLDLDPDRFKQYVPDRPGHDRRYLLDSSRISEELGWGPEVEFEEGIEQTVLWYKNHPGWWQPLVERVSADESSWK